MRITTINQFAGHNSIGETLKGLLADKSKEFHTVKFLMAFVNLSGYWQAKRQRASVLDALSY
jgi:hypothetical protein